MTEQVWISREVVNWRVTVSLTNLLAILIFVLLVFDYRNLSINFVDDFLAIYN